MFLFLPTAGFISTGSESRFNPLFIRSVFLFWQTLIPCQEKIFVSIPYSSGQCFFSAENFSGIGSAYMFQSLIHQVSVSFKHAENFISTSFPTFQSLIHQVSVSFMYNLMRRIEWLCVGFNPLFIRSVFLLLFISCKGGMKGEESFNPLFIRSVFLL